MKPDCSFYYFNPDSGKWKYEGEGVFTTDEHSQGFYVTHDSIYEGNKGMPGISGDGKHYTICVVPHESCEHRYAYPRLIKAIE